MANKSEKIRELAAQNVATADIARRLGIRYQHAYNVLKRNVSTQKEPSSVNERPVLTSIELLKVGFVSVAEWRRDAADDLVLVGSLPQEPGVYAFVNGGGALYVGVATMGIAKRLRFYRRPGSTQTTSIRIKAKLLEVLKSGARIDIYTAQPPSFSWNGMTVNGIVGLEHGLIATHTLAWNIRGAK